MCECESERVLYDMASLCERWGATEDQVRRIWRTDAALLEDPHELPNGAPLFDSGDVEHTELYLPELARRDAAAAIAALAEAEDAVSAEYPVIEGGHDACTHEWQRHLWEERHVALRRGLEARAAVGNTVTRREEAAA